MYREGFGSGNTRVRRTGIVALARKLLIALWRYPETGPARITLTNVFVEDALRARLRERRKARIYAAYEQASHDPPFMRDMNADLKAFDHTLSDGLTRPR